MNITAGWQAKQTVTITLTSLANGSAQQSAVIDAATLGALDALLRVQSKGTASSTARVDVYVYSSLNDTTYTDGATGSDAAFTAANRIHSKPLPPMQMNGTAPVSLVESVAAAFGGVLPPKFGFIFINNSGAALSATPGDHIVEVELLVMAA